MSFDARAHGTSAATWRGDERLAGLAPLRVRDISALTVVAAHPDDETLGAGGLIAACARRGIPVTLIVVTDGAASHPEDPTTAPRRAREALAAIGVLAPRADVYLLGFGDGRTAEDRARIRPVLSEILSDGSPDATVLAPWRGDGHRDHRVVGEIVADLVPAQRLWEYPIWMWHWAHPDHPDVPWGRMRGVAIDPEPKQRALAGYTSQTAGANPQLTASFLDHFTRPQEIMMTVETALGEEYFDNVYEGHDDPWRFQTRWYEERKRAVTLASLPQKNYGRVLEIGCSIGVLTEQLARRSDALLAVDVAEEAVTRARERLDEAGLAGVDVQQLDARTDLPDGPFDLIVLSEVGYYLDANALERFLFDVKGALADDGTLVACHWRHHVDDYPLTGDEVHATLDEAGLPRLVHHLEADFVLGVYSRDERSVAVREGLA